jgi:osmoprotectant transport system substrate-binding protein
MRFSRVAALGAAMLVAIAACSSGGGSSAKPDIKVGSDGFYESELVAEMFAQVLEADGFTVTRNLGIGAREVRQPALESGQIDLTPEYVGSGLGYYDKAAPTGDGPTNRQALAQVLADKGISVFAISPGEDTNAAVVRKDTADQYDLKTMSDLAAVQDELKWGLTPECDVNPLCKGALEAYGITFPPKQRETLEACSAPIAEALNSKGIDFGWLCSTQPAIQQFGFVALEDDKNTQPAENMTALVRNAYLDTVGDKDAFQQLLDKVTALLTTEELTRLGVEVAVDQRDIADVAKDFLTENALLK